MDAAADSAPQPSADAISALGEAPDRDAAELYADILRLLRRQCGADFSCYKPSTLVRRMSNRCRMQGYQTLAAYREHLAASPGDLAALRDDLLINVTGFFRDASAWDALAETVLRPTVAAASAGGVIRAWTAGAASGEEAYALAMLLSEAIEADGRGLDYEVLATDLDEASLRESAAGRYRGEVVREQVGSARAARHFVDEGETCRIAPELRDRVVVARHNLTADPPPRGMDLVVCRNVLIFMERQLQRVVLDRLVQAAKPGGWLFFGVSEAAAEADPRLVTRDETHRLYRVAAAAGGAAARGAGAVAPPVDIEARLRADDHRRRAAVRHRAGRDLAALTAATGTGVIHLDAELRIVEASPTAASLLGLGEAGGRGEPLDAAALVPRDRVEALLDAAAGDPEPDAPGATGAKAPTASAWAWWSTRGGRVRVRPVRQAGDAAAWSLVVSRAAELDRAESALKRVESELERTRSEAARFRERFDAVVDASRDLPERVIGATGDGRVRSWPEGWLGIASDAARGGRLDELLRLDDASRLAEAMRQASRGRDPEPVTVHLQHDPDAVGGEATWVLVCRPLDDAGVVITARPTALQERVERMLRGSQSFLDAAIDALDPHLAVLDRDGRIVAVNRAWRDFARANGLPDSDGGVGRYYLQSCDPDAADRGDVDAVSRGLSSVLTGRTPRFEHEYPCHGPGERRWFLMTASGFEHEGERWTAVAHVNITRRRLLEAQVQDQARATAQRLDAFAAVFDALPVPTAIVNRRGEVVRLSRALRERLGPTARRRLPASLEDLFGSPGRRLDRLVRHAVASGDPHEAVVFDDLFAPPAAAASIDLRPVAGDREDPACLIVAQGRGGPSVGGGEDDTLRATLDLQRAVQHALRQRIVTLASGASAVFAAVEADRPPPPLGDAISRAAGEIDRLLRQGSAWVDAMGRPLSSASFELAALIASAASQLPESVRPALELGGGLDVSVEGDPALLRSAFAAALGCFTRAEVTLERRPDPALRIHGEADDDAEALGLSDAGLTPMASTTRAGGDAALAEAILRRLGGDLRVQMDHRNNATLWFAWPGLATV